MPITNQQQQVLKQQQEQLAQKQAQAPVTAPQPQQPKPQSSAEWDYKSSVVNPNGETLPAGAKGWTPFGQPYFGPGLGGTIKKYAWSLMGSPTQGPDEDRWQSFLDLTDKPDFWNNPLSKDFGQAAKTFGQGLTGTDKNAQTAATDWNAVKEANARMKQIQDEYNFTDITLAKLPAEVKAEYNQLQKDVLGKGLSAAEGKFSLLTPVLRGSKVAVQAVMDVLSEASVKFEQAQGAQSAMRDYAQANSDLPALAFDINRDKSKDLNTKGQDFQEDPALAIVKSEAAQNGANIASRLLLVPLDAWDALRFWTAPGTVQQKQKAISEGWDAGRILYSQAIKPSLLEEYKRRAAAGEDPQLLAMELQNPWAEAVGQAILDPLNVIGAVGKGVKAAGMLDDATDLVKGGELGDEATKLLSDAGKTMAGPLGETTAAARMEDFDKLVTKAVDRLESTRLTPDYNKLTSYSPSGMRVRETKVVQTTSNIVTSSVMRNGGSADDIADFFHYLSKATSTDKAARLEAWDNIMTMSQRFGMGRYPFSDDVLETGVLLRNLTEGDESSKLLAALKAGKGDLSETAKILDRTFQRAVEKQIPTYTQVKKGAEAFKTGADTSRQAERLSGMYEGVKNKVLWNLHEGKLGDFKQQVNSFLGKFFFAQPGFAVRNWMNNSVTMFVDQGFSGVSKAYYREGKFWSMASIEDDLMKYFGGKLPPAVGGIQSVSQAENASSWVTKFNENIESGFAKRIYWRNFRETMDKFLTPGVALPTREEFKALGMADEQIKDFVHILKNKTYGNVEKAITEYTKLHDENGLLDLWKSWSGSVSADEMKGLTEVGLTKEIENIVDTAQTPQEITDRISKLKQELANRAASTVDNPIGVNRERKGFEFMDGIGKATEGGLMDVDGTNRLNILIESSEKATDELMRAIGKARDTVTDPALRQQFSVMEEAFSAERRGFARTSSQQLTDTAWTLTKRARKSTGLEIEKMWAESILAKHGPPPAGLTKDKFLSELWDATRNQVSDHWETYFSDGFDRLTPLVDNLTEAYPELQGIFQKSQKASAELNMYRTATYRDGKIFYSQPPQSVAELASRYGVASATAEGVPMDKQLLNTINKYSGGKYKTLDEVPLDEAERALQARAAQRGTQTTAETANAIPAKADETYNPLGTRAGAEVAAEADGGATIRYADGGIDKLTPEEVAKHGGIDSVKQQVQKAQENVAKSIESATQREKEIQAAKQTDELGPISQVTPTNPEVQIQPPYVDGSTPIPGQMWKENADGIVATLNKVETYMLDNYGLKAAEKMDGSTVKALKGLLKDSGGRITEGVAIADKIGKEWRDFALLPYGETRNFDLALSYAFPYQFWYSRSYANWMKRVATDPQVIANYARIKESMSRINKDSPEWWRYNVEIPSHFLGLPNEHPMSFNLEANLWPLYGLTGTDFEDPQKRQNWLTSTVDDIGKFGPSVWSPIQWAIALAYRAQGENELAQAWAGRVIPQTATIKAISSYFGKPVELDPMVQIFSGKGLMDTSAMDKYERNRVGRALTAMVQDGSISEEQAIEVARTQSGPAWDEAVKRATQLRAPGQISSYFLGVGMKARTEEDRVTDEFYQSYYRLNNLNEAGLISPQEYQKGWDGLREKYPFMDALLLSRKAGPDRDRAYAYNVLGRIPPGQASDLYKLVGIDPKTAQKFYDNKGDLSFLSDSERERFMSAMVDLGATLALPDSTTKQEWNLARNDYKAVKDAVTAQFGQDIFDKIEYSYTLEGPERDRYISLHPEIEDARQVQNEYVINNPDLYKFYGGLETIQKFQNGKMYDALDKKFGDMQPIFDQYYELQLTDSKAAKRFKRAHPEMDAYNKEKARLRQISLAALVKFSGHLPDAPQLQYREDFQPGNPVQNALQGYNQGQQELTAEDFQQQLGGPLMNILAHYYADLQNNPTKARLPFQASKELDFRAGKLGYSNGDDLLRDVLLSLGQ
jgi:hypothetical protein